MTDGYFDLQEGVNDPGIFKAVFLAGGPGSGKSFIVGKTALTTFGLKLINSDDAFETGLKKAGMDTTPKDIFSDKGQEIRARAVALTGKKQQLAINGRLGLVIDGTGKDFEKISNQARELRRIGYDVAMIFVNTNLETAQARNAARKRTLPADEVEKMWKSVQNNIGKFQNLFGRYMYVLDNSDGARWQGAVQSAYKRIGAWTKEEPSNPIAKKWIKNAKAERGITEEIIDEAKNKNPFKYYKKPSNKKEAQSNINYWHYEGMLSTKDIEDMGKIPANYKSYIKSMKQDAQRELKNFKEEVELDESFKKGRKVKVFLAKSRDRELKDLASKFGDTIVGTVTGQSGNYYMVKTPKGQLNPHKDDILGEEVELGEEIDINSAVQSQIEKGIKVPHIQTSISTLGPKTSLAIRISLDDKSTWQNGIFHNSRYGLFMLRGEDNKLEMLTHNRSGTAKFRKTKIKDVKDLISKLTKWVESSKSMKEEKEMNDLNTKNVDKALAHDCAKHVVHEEWGHGNCIPGMHTLEEGEDGVGFVTHYDVMFEHGVEQNVSIEDLAILVSESHTHSKKKKNEEMDPVGQADADIDNDGDVDDSDKYLKKRRKAISNAIAKKKDN